MKIKLIMIVVMMVFMSTTVHSNESKVAIIDDGVDLSHPYFADKNIEVHEVGGIKNNDINGHGTGVISTFLKISPDAHVISIDIKNGDECVFMADAMKEARMLGVDMISISMSYKELDDYWIDKLQEEVYNCREEGIYIFVSGGNTNNEKGYPALLDGVIAVGAMRDPYVPIKGYPYADYIDYYYNGWTSVIADTETGGWKVGRGSSYATPAVASIFYGEHSFRYHRSRYLELVETE